MELWGGRAWGEFHKFQFIRFFFVGKEKGESRVFWLLVAVKGVWGCIGRILHHILNSPGKPKYLIEDCLNILIWGEDRAPISMSDVLKSCMRNALYDRGASTNPKAPPLHLHSPLQALLPVADSRHMCVPDTKSTPSDSWNLKLLLSFMITDRGRSQGEGLVHHSLLIKQDSKVQNSGENL